MKIRSIKSKIILALCLLISLLILQSYFFNYSQKSLLSLQKKQHNALIQNESVASLENDVISLQSQAIAFVDHANENTIEKFSFYLSAAHLNLNLLKTNTLQRTPEYQKTLTRIGEYLNNYQETFDQVVINRAKRELVYATQFKQPITDLKKQITNLETNANIKDKGAYTDILLTISNLEHASVSYLYKPNFDEAQNVKQNLQHLHLRLINMPQIKGALINNTADLKQALNQLVLLTRGYTFSINVVLTGIENELLYLANQVKVTERKELQITEDKLTSQLVTNTERANMFAGLIMIIIALVSYLIFKSIIKPINQLTQLLKDMNNEKQITLSNTNSGQTEIASVIRAANTLYLKNKQTKELLSETQTLNIQMEKMNKDLTSSMEQTHEANKAKGDFVANMSHELRTPMNGILGMLQLLQSSALPSRQKHYVDKAFSSAYNLLHILNNILDFSKLESEKVQLETIPFTLHTIISNAQNLFSTSAKQKGLALNFTLHVDTSLELIGDPLHLSQIINNCIGNAIKFTEHGEVSLIVEASSQHKKTINLRFTIKDTGIGMTDEQSKRVFQSFSQGDSSTTRKYGGTGLGLTISKQLTTLLGGDIQVRSALNQGSEFFFTLPFVLSEQQALKKHALLISPSSEQINKLMDLLSSTNITTETTQEPLRAIAKISQPNNPFSIVIMSLEKKELKDNFILQQLETQNKSTENKLLLILLISDEEHPEQLPKNNNIDITVIGNIHTETQLLEKLSPKAPKTESIQSFPQFSGFSALIVDDNKINQEIMAALLTKLDMNVIIANDGAESLKLADENDFDIIFMDIQMPIMDGLEATRTLRSRGYTTPIIAITAAAHTNDKKAALRAGMDDFLAKPILLDTLHKNIEKHLQSNRTLSTINLPLAKENIDNNDELLEKLFSKFINDYSSFANKTEKLIKNNEINNLTILIHTLKGIAGTLGLELLEQSTIKVEKKLVNEKTIELDNFNEQLTLTLYAVKQFLVTKNFQNKSKQLGSQKEDISAVDEIYSLALTSRPIPSSLIRQLEMNQYDRDHPLLKLKEAIDCFNYHLVIELIDQYRNNNKN
ncbi:response regulator [Pseudoalteromonas sp. SWXJZ94C]|uniref:hybrid sensor histidine kinase/response regulator n=1 Tax=unclassified Pseudoalteromonas TaxID=194690 RepID=UPI00140D355D|nr:MULTISPECIES: response regulator [unclassified Pseudoalteromonas]MBH0056173.1 response regulator [Pseudoalteromonas sp. SWXJZ94C]